MNLLNRLCRLSLLAAAVLHGTAMPSRAQEPATPVALRVASGPAGKIYALMVQDMQSVCGSVAPSRAVASSGGLQNLSLLSASEAELGIVQLDTLREMKAGDENILGLQAIMPLHNNLLHVLTLASGSVVGGTMVAGKRFPGTGTNVVVRKFSELKGLAIAVVGSAQLMGQKLETQLGYGMRFLVAESDDDALALLRANTVQAVFTLGGWPLPAITRHTVTTGLLLADYDLSPQAPYVSVKRNYQKLDVFNRTFLGVPNLLLTRPFRPGGPLGRQVLTLQSCLRQHLDELQEGRYQAAWKEIRDADQLHGVARFPSGASAAAARTKRP